MPNTANPELVYWFLSPEELAESEYTKQLDLLKSSGTFDFVFLTQRGQTNFYDTVKMRPIFQDLVSRAHKQGMKVGLQLWTRDRDVPDDQLQGIVVETEATVDAGGHIELEARSRGVRSTATADRPGQSGRPLYAPVRSELLRIYAFKKSGEGQLVPGSMVDVTAKAKVVAEDAATVHVELNDPSLAGLNVYAMTVHYHRFPDMFSHFMRDSFDKALQAYRDVGFDGAAMDEFRYMTVGHERGQTFRERFYSRAMAEFYRGKTGAELERTLFDMRYAPAGNDLPRILAINRYFDMLKQGPLLIEQSFRNATTHYFGPTAFHGIHDTWHNKLDTDEIWGTGINWWTIPRDYAQSDEVTPMVTRLGMSMTRPKPIEYNQFYTKDEHRFLAEGLDDARYNGRVHYHALHDVQGWGIDVANPHLLEGIGKVENKVRLLNAFDAPRPAVNVLFLFGFPSLFNYLQKSGVRGEWDINTSLKVEEKAVAAWNAGYRAALAPTELLEDGTIRVDDHGGMSFGGQRFTSVIMIGLEYSKEPTWKAFESFVAGGGKLLLDGAATRDFAGNDVTPRFRRLAEKAVVTEFSLTALDKLGTPKTALEGGARYVDGSVVMTDVESLLQDKPVPFSFDLSGHTFTGSYEGLLALRIAPSGAIEKLAAGHLEKLERDGKPIVTLSKPADLVLLYQPGGQPKATVVGDAELSIH